jgi:hypothetical protein
MARRGSIKELSVRQEDHIADLFDGRRSPSSGAADTAYADVNCKRLAIECKMTMSKSKPKLLKDFEKVAREAWEHDKEPMVALRYYDPDSILASRDGWIDLTVRLASSDAERERNYVEIQA